MSEQVRPVRTGEVEIRLLACPKCKGTAFEIYHVAVEDFFLPISKGSLDFELFKCKTCGWESHPRDKGKLRQLVINMLRGFSPEGLIYAPEQEG
jgi:hypothetical protein